LVALNATKLYLWYQSCKILPFICNYLVDFCWERKVCVRVIQLLPVSLAIPVPRSKHLGEDAVDGPEHLWLQLRRTGHLNCLVMWLLMDCTQNNKEKRAVKVGLHARKRANVAVPPTHWPSAVSCTFPCHK